MFHHRRPFVKKDLVQVNKIWKPATTGHHHTLGCGKLILDLLGELVLIAGLRRSISSAVSCCWIGSANETRLD